MSGAPAPGAPWIELSRVLLDAIAAHLGALPEGAGAEPREQILAIRRAFSEDPSSHQAFITGVEVQDTLERFAGASRAHNAAMAEHLRGIAGLLMAHRRENAELATAIEQLRAAVQASADPAILWRHRVTLGELLDRLHDQAGTGRERHEEIAGKLYDRMAVLEKYVGPSPPSASSLPGSGMSAVDPVTGLPSWNQADQAIPSALVLGRRLAIFLVHRMDHINARFGHDLGDRVLWLCGRHIGAHVLAAPSALYRWKGPRFLGIIQGAGDRLAAQLRSKLAEPLHESVETPYRTVYLPLRISVSVVPEGKTTPAMVRDWLDRAEFKCG